jgi:ABC-type transporter Mla subunit MlaD
MSFDEQAYREAGRAVYVARARIEALRRAAAAVDRRLEELARLNHRALASTAEEADGLHEAAQGSLRTLRDNLLPSLRSAMAELAAADGELAPLLDQLIEEEEEGEATEPEE